MRLFICLFLVLSSTNIKSGESFECLSYEQYVAREDIEKSKKWMTNRALIVVEDVF